MPTAEVRYRLPVIETQAGDVSAYIPTNVISITDGQIYETDLFHAASARPLTWDFPSPGRRGGADRAMKQVAGRLRLTWPNTRAGGLCPVWDGPDKATRARLSRGERMMELLKQGQYQPMPVEEQIVVIYAAVNRYLDALPLERIRAFEREYLHFLRSSYPQLLQGIREKKLLDEELEALLKTSIQEFLAGFAPAGGDDS